jgi:hypothetical protein
MTPSLGSGGSSPLVIAFLTWALPMLPDRGMCTRRCRTEEWDVLPSDSTNPAYGRVQP